MHSHFGTAITRIERIGAMKPGWNGHRAPVTSPEVRSTAISFLRKLSANFGVSVPEPTLVAPTSDGGIALEWRLRTPAEAIEFVFLPRGLHEYTLRDLNKGHLDRIGEDVSEDELLGLAKIALVGRVTV
jgi:hypothetical protein